MKISVVAPVYNEEGCLSEFYRRTRAVIDPLKIDAEWIRKQRVNYCVI